MPTAGPGAISMRRCLYCCPLEAHFPVAVAQDYVEVELR
jgi:hypothetical protein